MSDIAIKIENVSKEYRLGAIGGTTLREEIQRFTDKLFHRNPENADYGKKFMALQNINLEVKKGERLGIIGHNGAGKSTLLKLLARVTGPTTGTIAYNGRISSMLEVGTGFHGELTGRENIYMNGAILGMTKKEIDGKIDNIIEFAEMEKFIDTPVKRYSSGMYVKLAFAVAAHLDNEIMIMDEVLAVGDMKFQQKCLGKMDDASKEQGKTIMYVSHNMNTIRQLCERCIVLEHGKIIFNGDVDEAIALYMGLHAQTCNVIDTTKIKRSPVASQKELSITEFRHLNGKNGILKERKNFKGQVKIIAHTNVEKMMFRITIRSIDGTPIAMATEKNAFDLTANSSNKLSFNLDTSMLVPGKYLFSIVSYKINEFGTYHLMDGMDDLYSFEICSEPGWLNNINWQTKHWGHVHIDSFNVVMEQ